MVRSTIKSAVDLRSFEGAEIKFDDSRWEEFMDSMTYADQSLLITNGNMTTSTLESIDLPATALDAYRDNAYFALKVRDFAKRIIYNIVNFSASMNGISSNTKVESVTPWWDTLLTTLVITSGILAAGALAMSIVSRGKGRKEQ